MNKRCRPHPKPTNKSYRTDQTYIKVKGKDRYLYRAVDSTGQTIEFLLTAKRDAAGAKAVLSQGFEYHRPSCPACNQCRRSRPRVPCRAVFACGSANT